MNIFAIYDHNSKTFLDYEYVCTISSMMKIPTVPVLYQGPFQKKTIYSFANGKSTIANHIREGVVVTPVRSRYTNEVGWLKLKCINDAYLTRKGGTEFN